MCRGLRRESPGTTGWEEGAAGWAGGALRQESVLALALTDSLGFSFYRDFQCSSANFLTGNFDRFVN